MFVLPFLPADIEDLDVSLRQNAHTNVKDEPFSEPFYGSNNADAVSNCHVDLFDVLDQDYPMNVDSSSK
ncbi:hypothetical protein ARMGADRAFT_1079089 [Armillaria gallica]|uniref:Uncharacterized protein n=1 Tax=Armillaria gallica TaxID=47427 RepID=A0A2H3DUB0_ARMGA|nr:hypothetical protein ARMGADRAFT_1079089 [Armillaria gallica]